MYQDRVKTEYGFLKRRSRTRFLIILVFQNAPENPNLQLKNTETGFDGKERLNPVRSYETNPMNVAEKTLKKASIDLGSHLADNIIADTDAGHGSLARIHSEMVDSEYFVYEGPLRRKKIERK